MQDVEYFKGKGTDNILKEDRRIHKNKNLNTTDDVNNRAFLWRISFFILSLQSKRSHKWVYSNSFMKYTIKGRLIVIVFCLLPLCSFAQERADSDSIIRNLETQLQEMRLQSIIIREKLEMSGQSAREDSLRHARRIARIDSLRKITPGAPLIVDGDTLLQLYARNGGMLADDRVAAAHAKIEQLGKKLTFFSDSCYVYESEVSSDIMAGTEVIMSLTDVDGMWQGTTRQELAQQYCIVIQGAIEEIHKDYGLKQKLMGALYVLLILAVQFFFIWLTRKLYRNWRFRLFRLIRKGKPLVINDYEILNLHRQGAVFLFVFKWLFYLVIFLQLLISIPLLFSVFPETKDFTYTIFGYIWNPVKDIVGSVISFLPNLFKIIVIVFCFRYLVKGVRFLSNEIESGRLKINGFYADWAQPTFLILRLLLYSFMFVMIWPLLPSSNSEVFQGVSVFIGVIISLGSSSIVGNVMAGMVMTYMRPFRVGDFIRYGDTEGFVIEKTVLVTRIRTRKNDIITIPNSNLMSSQTYNYTRSAEDRGIIVHTKVTIGYDMSWQLIRQLLLDAAKATPGIVTKPEPFVIVTALDDFYVEYEINAYTTNYQQLPVVYSGLHQNILDNFHKAGVEIMSPHIFAHRNDLGLQIPEQTEGEKK